MIEDGIKTHNLNSKMDTGFFHENVRVLIFNYDDDFTIESNAINSQSPDCINNLIDHFLNLIYLTIELNEK